MHACLKGAALTWEAAAALLAFSALLPFFALHQQGGQGALEALYEFQALNGFLEVREKAGLDSDYVARSGFCLSLRLDGGEVEFLPRSCADSAPRAEVSVERPVVLEGGRFAVLKASLWKR
jgi:hypothetical protein